MSRKHPIVAVTGSSGAGTSTVKNALEHIFHRVGARAAEMGLIEGVGHLVPKMKERFGDKVRFQVFQQRRPFWSRLGSQIVEDAATLVEERLAYARFGL